MAASLDGEMESTELISHIMSAAKKEFRKRLINHLIIIHGMQEDETYDYLFHKIDKYRENA